MAFLRDRNKNQLLVLRYKRWIFFGIVIHFINFYQAKAQSFTYPFQNYHLSFEERAKDLVSRLTLEEKVAQMMNTAPAIDRLGIPAYDWWNETLHGVARTPYKVTVYPQAIALSATFDVPALYQTARYSAIEGRAIFNKAKETGNEGKRYQGLTYWTPNINIFRDPRWGRGQETYGEDPYLTSMMGDAFVRGLQGDDAKYLLAAACAKHYAVHSGPEPLRHVFDVNVSNYDLWDTYLPAFHKLVVDSKVAGVMCAYNAFRTQPCCGNDILMTDILRNQWNFKGYVTSDCWAIDDFFKNHKTHPDAESASADAVFHGTDVDCGTSAFLSLVQAVKDGKITEHQIDISVQRLFLIRFRLGMFDPSSMVPYANTSISELESPKHQAQSLKMARESIVLLRNENHTLPLNKKLKKIVVLGPNADNDISVLGNYNGTPSKITTILQGIKDKVGDQTEVVYQKAVNFTNDTLLAYDDNIKKSYAIAGKSGIKAEYFNNKNLEGQAQVVRMEADLHHFWQEGEQVVHEISARDFSARYTTDFKAEKTGDITFELSADDGYRFFVNGKKVLDAWYRNRWGAQTYTLKTEKDSVYHLKVEYWQGEGKGEISLNAGHFQATDFKALANKVKDADAIIMVGGISPQLEGEEMPVNYPGFSGGDRTSILLPQVQTALMKALVTTGKPLVFVMMTGSAIAIPWESQNVPAIVNAWYGGESAGTAVADVLFGDYNPSGRLPVTFYASDSDLPAFTDYKMENRTYRYFKGKALYPFGYGLSYTSFHYDQLQMPSSLDKGATLNVSVRVTNTGNLPGGEVPQLYVINEELSTKAPLKALKAFDRLYLKPGESKIVKFQLKPEDLSHINEEGNLVSFQSKIGISVGGYQPDETNVGSSNIIKRTLLLK